MTYRTDQELCSLFYVHVFGEKIFKLTDATVDEQCTVLNTVVADVDVSYCDICGAVEFDVPGFLKLSK